jgi:hypothetical protein
MNARPYYSLLELSVLSHKRVHAIVRVIAEIVFVLCKERLTCRFEQFLFRTWPWPFFGNMLHYLCKISRVPSLPPSKTEYPVTTSTE